MSFLSFHLGYYRHELRMLETTPADMGSLYHAKQLLKILDDLLDEGYTELNDALEMDIRGVSRLHEYLSINGATPFPLSAPPSAKPFYNAEPCELTAAIDSMMLAARNTPAENSGSFPLCLTRFCQWIGYEPDTAYIFLLRDALLPYVYFKSRGRKNLYPWLLGRKSVEKITGIKNADDRIRSAIINALESGGGHSFDSFCGAVLPSIRSLQECFPQIENSIGNMLKSITADHIIVVESGCSGTFPMLLRAMDDRVDIRMYTTYPYLLETYGKRIFTPAYEENRLFETLYSQDMLFQFADLKEDTWYVYRCADKQIREKALYEIKAMI